MRTDRPVGVPRARVRQSSITRTALPNDTPDHSLDVVPLGGLGQFGMNMMALSFGDATIVVDAGVMFPEPDQLGVDLIVPDLSYLQEPGRRVIGLVLTHGHEDHIGAIPYVLPYIDGPIYGTALTLALVEAKLARRRIDTTDRFTRVVAGDTIDLGPFSVEFVRVTHSIPDCVALAIRTPVGTVVHTGDVKIDQTPLDGEHLDIHRFAEIGREGVLAMFGDSTNVDRPGFTGSERDVVDAFQEILSAARGKVVVATFASSLHRIQILVDLAARYSRKVAFVGHGVSENSQIAERLGRLRVPAGLQIRDSEVKSHPPGDVLCIATGSQGEPLAALSRIAIDDHRHVKVGPDDVVVFSARAIPGNEKAIGRVMNHLARRGAEIVDETSKRVHVSGHGSAEELKLLLSLVKPRHFVPIHGEYRQLARHAHIAAEVAGSSSGVMLSENGDILRFDEHGASRAGKASVGRVLIDGSRTGEVIDEVLRDRRHLAADGLVVPVIAINSQTGAMEAPPEVVSRGLAIDDRTAELLNDLSGELRRLIEDSSLEERTDHGFITEKARVELQRLFRRRTGRRPLVLPVIMEI